MSPSIIGRSDPAEISESTPPAGKGAAPAVAFAIAYSILMYVTQQQKVTSAKITATFSYTTQENNYANFYDDARQSWSILFDNEKNATDFAKHVCLAKALSTGPVPTSMVTQDLVAGEGGALETGDSVEVRYTGWLLANNTFGQVFDSNASADKLFRFKLGAGKVIKVKLIGRESTPSPHPTHPAPGGSGDGEEIEEDDVTVKQRTRSINEQLSHSPTQDMSKAKLISRMAKMGKPMLPLSGAVPAGPESDHDDHVPESPTPISGQAANQGAPSPAPVHQRVTPVAQPAPIVQPQPAFVPVQQPVAPAQTFTGFTNQQQPAFLQNLPVSQQMSIYQPQQSYLQQQQAGLLQTGFQPGMTQAGMPGMGQGTDMMLLSETRQQNTEVRLSLSKVSDKLDNVIQKENERLKKDVFDKSAKIETQNEKISELLQRNQSFVEKSQVLMEQRNEGMLSSANQTQTRVLTLEQDKVGLTKQLSEATSQISALQMEVSGLKKHDHISDLQRQLREERQGKKSVEGSMAQLQEEMSDLQAAKQALEKAEIQSLKEKLRKQKTSASVSSQVQISQLEEEITADWKARSNKLVALAEEKHARALRAVNEEKEEMAEKIQELTNKIQSIRESHSGSDQHVSELEERVEQLAPWKDKYESLRANASTMKEHYEGRIEELEEGQTTLERQLEAARASQGDSAAAAAGSPQGLLDEVKKIMNNVYKELREQFEAGESYTGTKVLQAILASIKSTTLALMKRQESQATEEESGSEEEEEEAEEEEDDDDDDDDDDDEEEDEEESEEENEETAEQKPEPTVIKTEISEDKPSTGVEDNKKVDDEDDVDKKAGENEGDVEKEDLDKECVDEEDKQDEVEEDAESYQDELDAEIEGQSRAGKADIDKGTGDGQETKRETSEQTNTAVNKDSDDDNMAASLGISTKAVVNGEPTSKSIEKQTSNDEDLKPQPPPPLFGDDDDDDDLDWLIMCRFITFLRTNILCNKHFDFLNIKEMPSEETEKHLISCLKFC
ncbi:FKB15-like protein [Mya arenaria]|uniref:peptidylprolyl isomerase n=1 Tax=Mya arenaria TaxID=6604 RepID=A0ABY7GA86_MYAAR|nr:FKB15-like protein [Mya arenaria]